MLSTIFPHLLAPSWEKQSVPHLLLRYSCECAISTLLVVLSYMAGLNLLVTFLLLLLVYSRDVVIFETNAHLIVYGSLTTTTEVAKVFHLPFLINTIALIIIPLGLPTLICVLDLGGWNNTFSSIISVALSHNAAFLKLYENFPILGQANHPEAFGVINPSEQSAILLVYINNFFALISGLLVGLALLLRKSYRTALYKVAWFHNQESNLEKHNYAGIVFLCFLYPLLLVALSMTPFNPHASITGYVWIPLMGLFLGSFVNQYLMMLSANLKKWRPL